jgi:hypothetical protein
MLLPGREHGVVLSEDGVCFELDCLKSRRVLREGSFEDVGCCSVAGECRLGVVRSVYRGGIESGTSYKEASLCSFPLIALLSSGIGREERPFQ